MRLSNSLQSNSAKEQAVDQSQHRWVQTDPASLESLLSSPLAAQLPATSFYAIANFKASVDPRSAMAWADTFYGEKRPIVAGEVFKVWLTKDLNEALDWYRHLPPNDPRHEILTNKLSLKASKNQDPDLIFHRLTDAQREAISKQTLPR